MVFRRIPARYWKEWDTGSMIRCPPTTSPRSWSARPVLKERRSAGTGSTGRMILVAAPDRRWATSVPIPKFVAFVEPDFELRNRKDTSKPIDIVWLWFRSPHHEPAAAM